MATKDRRIMTELIELYCEFPCLWDMSSDLYKDKKQKAEAWYLLTEKLCELEPDATVVCTKKKIEHFRTAYQREARKVQASKRNTSDPKEVHIPTLWYYKLLSSILGKDDEERTSEVDPLGSEEESQEPERAKARNNNKTMLKKHRDRVLERKKLKFIQAKQELQQQQAKPQDNYPAFLPQSGTKRPNSFVAYVEEQLDQVGMFQRNVAEKLISEVLFLAKTGHLTFDTTVTIPSNSRTMFSSTNNSYSHSVSSQMIQPTSPQSNQSATSPQHIVSCPSFQYLQSSPSHSASSQIVQLSDPVPIEQDTETPDKSVLKELLIHKKPKSKLV